VHQEVEELKPKLKEILYDCAVDIRATKAALYLFDGTGRFDLVTEFGFRAVTRKSVDFNDPLVDRCGRGRTPFYLNGIGAEPRFSQLMFELSSDRLLVAPLYARGKLIGFVDMRDKQGKQRFEETDVPKAQEIADRLVSLFANMNLFGHNYISLSKSAVEPRAVGGAEQYTLERTSAPVAAPTPGSTAAGPAIPIQAPREPPRPAALKVPAVVGEARSVAGRIAAPAPASLTEAEIAAARDVLRTVLLVPGAVVATFSAFGHLGGLQEIAARSSLADDARTLVQSKLQVWLTKRGDAGGFVRTSVHTPFGTAGPAIRASQVQKVFTAPLKVGAMRGLYLTVGFDGIPDRLAHELLAALHNHLQLVIEHSLLKGEVAVRRSRIAQAIIEPDLATFPALRRHSESVAKHSEAFARFLGQPEHVIDEARVVGMVHDAGLRLLDYDRLHRKRDLTAEELGLLREHPWVSAAIVEPLLGEETARAVLCHHERVDGTGYPNSLRGDQIPLVSRIVQICDAFVAITDPDTYQIPEPPGAALAGISLGAGAQFDADLAARFTEMIRTRAY
jgi:hypothetical protein